REVGVRYGRDRLRAEMEAVQDAAETKVRNALAKLPAGERTFVDYLETDEQASVPIMVRITLHPPPNGVRRSESHRPAAVFDFTGTGDVVDGNLNANRAIVGAAVLYVLRLLVDEDIPLNDGAMNAVELIVPPGLLNPRPASDPRDSPAVAAGNVETSQRLVDILLGAMGLAAASQGTMNNVVFGNQTFGCYETICGGSGATVDADGAHAVQVHMTNTRATDPEILERRMPVRLLELRIRRGSGGAGRRRGGDGAVRKIEFLQSLELSLITERRGPHPPFGLAGGKPGLLGVNTIERADGSTERLPGICQRSVHRGDCLIVCTPGGGGFGAP
ncbi:MAG: hydantoinase B/oxoprolinase family protein, partial [Planctomycetota bacterium]